VRIPFSAREAEATLTLASRATVVIVGAAPSAVFGSEDNSEGGSL
jgi:hypothetical protein